MNVCVVEISHNTYVYHFCLIIAMYRKFPEFSNEIFSSEFSSREIFNIQ